MHPTQHPLKLETHGATIVGTCPILMIQCQTIPKISICVEEICASFAPHSVCNFASPKLILLAKHCLMPKTAEISLLIDLK